MWKSVCSEVLCVRNLPQQFKPGPKPGWPVNETETDTYWVLSVSVTFRSLVVVVGVLPSDFGGERMVVLGCQSTDPAEEPELTRPISRCTHARSLSLARAPRLPRYRLTPCCIHGDRVDLLSCSYESNRGLCGRVKPAINYWVLFLFFSRVLLLWPYYFCRQSTLL